MKKLFLLVIIIPAVAHAQSGTTIDGSLNIGVKVQAYHANLSTFSGINPSANVLTLLGAANYAAFKSSLSLGSVENTALSTWPGSTNVTTLGTIGTGTWNGTAIGDSYISSASTWNTASTDRLKWDGGSTGLTATTGRTSLGATTIGSNLFTLANPSAVTFPRFNADNTVDSRTAAQLKTDLGLTIGTDVQANDADLTTIAGLTATTDNFLVAVSSAWASRTVAQVKTTLALNSVENTAISTWAGSTNIVTIGTVTTGTWNAGVIPSTYGGTGVNNAGRNLTISTNSGTLAFQTAATTHTMPIATSTVVGKVATANIAATASATSATTIFTPTADGLFRVSVFLKITTTGTSPVAGPVTITYTDADGSVAQSEVLLMQSTAGAVVTTTVNNSTTTGTVSGSILINAKSGVAIQYAIAVSGTFGSGRYQAHVICEAL